MESLLGAGPEALSSYFDKAKNDDGAAYYPADDATNIDYLRILTAAKIEKDSNGNLRITIGLTNAESATAAEAVSTKADFTLSETIMIAGGRK